MPRGSAGENMTKKRLSRMRDQQNDLVTKAQSFGGRATTLVTPMSNPGYCATSVGPTVRTDNCAPSDSPASPLMRFLGGCSPRHRHTVRMGSFRHDSARCPRAEQRPARIRLPALAERQISAFGAGVSPQPNASQSGQNKGLAHRAAERVRRRRCAQRPKKDQATMPEQG